MYSCMIIQFLVVYVIYALCASAERYTSDYCWREFEGSVPNDALTAGADKTGGPVYIGQILFKDRLVPAKIHKNGKKIYFEWFDLDYPSNLNIKILCTKQPHKFEWLPAARGEAVDLGSRLLVKGGHELNYPTYIGRTVADGDTSIGKTKWEKTNKCEGLYTATKGSYKEHKVFEILSFNPQTEDNDSECNPLIDVRLGDAL